MSGGLRAEGHIGNAICNGWRGSVNNNSGVILCCPVLKCVVKQPSVRTVHVNDLWQILYTIRDADVLCCALLLCCSVL